MTIYFLTVFFFSVFNQFLIYLEEQLPVLDIYSENRISKLLVFQVAKSNSQAEGLNSSLEQLQHKIQTCRDHRGDKGVSASQILNAPVKNGKVGADFHLGTRVLQHRKGGVSLSLAG